MSSTNTEERTRKLWQDKQRQEHAKMRLCDDLQREAVTYNNKALHYRQERDFSQSVRNGVRRQEAQISLIQKLVVITAARKKLQEQLGMPPTEDGYVDCGKHAGIGSVPHY
ncbi:hypothetical protein J4E81_004425 [Alternaria sp. BMP 2799]|nr:hypothetical protein J4E81_004425 [Alternaria sp. BMP 2799]